MAQIAALVFLAIAPRPAAAQIAVKFANGKIKIGPNVLTPVAGSLPHPCPAMLRRAPRAMRRAAGVQLGLVNTGASLAATHRKTGAST